MNRLFVAYKPSGLSSNQFLSRIKRRYKVKKAGYSGTLDPFAKGVLIIALGNHGRLFRFLDKTPKTYRATLWLGAHSKTLDIEKVEKIDPVVPFDIDTIKNVLVSLEGELTYVPPSFSAKHIDGERAYELARAGKEVRLNPVTSTIHHIQLLYYCHPFITFEATVSEGTYIRSLGEIVSNKLGCNGALSSLERLSEGQFIYNGEKPLDIKHSLAIPKNRYNGDIETVLLGKKLDKSDFEKRQNGTYWIDNGSTISLFMFDDEGIHYILNKVEAC